MTTVGSDEFDYTSAVIETLREAGRPFNDEELWGKIMRRPDVPTKDRDMYWTPPFISGPYPRNFVMLKIVAQVAMHTDMGGHRPEAPLASTEDGYWLLEWGPLPLKEQQLRQEIEEDWAKRKNAPAPMVWPELDPYPESSLASEKELRVVAEKLVTFRSMVEGQRLIEVGSIRMGRVVQKLHEESGTLDESRRYHENRQRKIIVLMEWYGDAVRRADGADPQDLYTLVGLGLIRDPEKVKVPRSDEVDPAESTTRETSTQGGGCYVATSVYGDYDAPEVKVLRAWRDDVLSESYFGRGFIRFYYAVSPRLVEMVGGRNWFSAPSRWALDKMVRKLST